MNQFGTATPYIASYMKLRNTQGKIAFLLRRNTSWMSGYYGLPAGKVEKGETFSAAAIREAKEEVGVNVLPTAIEHALTMHRLSDDSMEWVDMFFEVAAWEGTPFNAEPQVHGELVWLGMDELPENVVPNVRFALEQIVLGKHYCEFGWEEQ
jgi:8-oxo-dGTP pyrophosphatase MutT (NUDIX family)